MKNTINIKINVDDLKHTFVETITEEVKDFSAWCKAYLNCNKGVDFRKVVTELKKTKRIIWSIFDVISEIFSAYPEIIKWFSDYNLLKQQQIERYYNAVCKVEQGCAL